MISVFWHRNWKTNERSCSKMFTFWFSYRREWADMEPAIRVRVCVLFMQIRFVFRVAISIPFMSQDAHKRILARVCGRARLCIEWKDIAILACLWSLCFDAYMFFLLIQVFTWFTYFNIQAPFIHICYFVCKIFVLSASFSVLMNRRNISAVFSWKETIRQMEISNVRLVLVYTCIESCKQMPYGDYFSQV